MFSKLGGLIGKEETLFIAQIFKMYDRTSVRLYSRLFEMYSSPVQLEETIFIAIPIFNVCDFQAMRYYPALNIARTAEILLAI